MTELSEQEINRWETKISKMSQIEMARLHRFAPSGHPVFRGDLPLHVIFSKRFKDLGGMTSQISKSIGWG